MRWLAAALCGLSLAGSSSAQDYPAPVSPNYARAYNYFLNSPYSYRTFSSITPGRRVEIVAPFSYQSYYHDPGYEHQRITPQGFERHVIVPGYGGDVHTPFWGSGYRVPGYGYSQYAPAWPLPRR